MRQTPNRLGMWQFAQRLSLGCGRFSGSTGGEIHVVVARSAGRPRRFSATHHLRRLPSWQKAQCGRPKAGSRLRSLRPSCCGRPPYLPPAERSAALHRHGFVRHVGHVHQRARLRVHVVHALVSGVCTGRTKRSGRDPPWARCRVALVAGEFAITSRTGHRAAGGTKSYITCVVGPRSNSVRCGCVNWIWCVASSHSSPAASCRRVTYSPSDTSHTCRRNRRRLHCLHACRVGSARLRRFRSLVPFRSLRIRENHKMC